MVQPSICRDDTELSPPVQSSGQGSTAVVNGDAINSSKGDDEKYHGSSNCRTEGFESSTSVCKNDGSDSGGSTVNGSSNSGDSDGSRQVSTKMFIKWGTYTDVIKTTWRDIIKMLPSLYMVSALCFHFFGYECARAASITMLAAKEVGLGTRGLSYTVVVGSPASAAVLYFYARSFKRNGALFTQRVSTILCILMLLFMVLMCNRLNSLTGRISVVFFYAFREIYVSLLSTQQWSFIASHLDKSKTSYLVTFAGIVSVSSAVGGCLVEYLVLFGGVWCLLLTALVCLVVSYLNVEIAHALNGDSLGLNSIIDRLVMSLMVKLGIIDKDEADVSVAPPAASSSSSSSVDKGKTTEGTSSGNHASGKSSASLQRRQSTGTSSQSSNVWRDAYTMFSKYQTLRLLLAEAVIHQFSSNMLNLMFHDGLRLNVADDSRRAVVVGRFFAVVNVLSCFIQCLVLPVLLSSQSLPHLMCSIPTVVALLSFLAFLYPGLLTTMFAFGALKVLEYSIMTSANEMIYMPMTTEVRSIGKELVRFFGQRLGKSSASLILSALSAHFLPSLATQSLWSASITLGWGLVMYPLATHLAERDRVIETAAEKRRDSISHFTSGELEASGESTSFSKTMSNSGLRNRRVSGAAERSSHVEEKSDTTNESDEIYSNKSSSNDDEEEDENALFDDIGSRSSNSGCSTPNLENIYLNWNVAAATMDGLPMVVPVRRRRAYTEGSDLLRTPTEAGAKRGRSPSSRIVYSAPPQKSNSEKSLEALCLDRHSDLTIKMPVLMLRIDSQLLSLDQLSSSSYLQTSPSKPELNPYAVFAQSLQLKNEKKNEKKNL